MSSPKEATFPEVFGRLADLPREVFVRSETALEAMPNLGRQCAGTRLFVKRDDCTGLAFGGNKARQLEFYFGEATASRADTILITGAVQSNFVRMAAAAARKLGMECHIQHEARVATDDPIYHASGNVLLDKILGATLHTYPHGEDEVGADRQVAAIAGRLREAGRKPYIIPLSAEHPPLGALGYVLAAGELLDQIEEQQLAIDRIFVASGSGATHAGLLFGLRALGSDIAVTGVCVRRDATRQMARIRNTCERIATLLGVNSRVVGEDIHIVDDFLAPGYGVPNKATLKAIIRGARTEALMLDPVYTGKAFAAFLDYAETADAETGLVFVHTGGSPAMFAYQRSIDEALLADGA